MEHSLSPDLLELLHVERLKLLEEIDRQTHNSTNSSDGAYIFSLRTHYNELMDQIDQIDKSPLLDPLEALPFDVFELIIEEFLRISAEVGGHRWLIEDLLPLTLVSTSWGSRILYTPRFWTQISIQDEGVDVEAKLATCLHLSRDLPLRLQLRFPSPFWDDIGRYILAQSYRIRSLQINTAYSEDSTRNCSQVQDFLQKLGPLTILEDLTVHGSMGQGVDLDIVLQNIPSLRYVAGVYLTQTTLKLDSMRNLWRIDLNQTHYKLIPYLTQLHKLKDLCSMNDESDLLRERHEEIHQYDNIMKLPRRDLGWTSFSIDYRPCPADWFLLECLYSTLSTLKLDLSSNLLTKLMVTCSHMVKLRDLTITLYISPEETFDPSAVIGYQTGIETLFLGTGSYGYLSESDKIAAQSACDGLAGRLGQALISWAPSVREFFIASSFCPSFFFSYFQNLPHFTHLYLYSIGNPDAVFQDCELPTLEYLCINRDKHSQILHFLSCPNASHFFLNDFKDFQDCSVLEPFRVYPQSWANLHTLEVCCSDVTWENITLPFVEEITVGVSASLLKELACNPSAFPSLKRLGMDSVPEWDILFVMLEKRNFSTLKAAVPITEVKLPSFPAPIILQPLVDRLRRRITERPSNAAISLQSLAEGYADMNIKGCGECHKSFRSCLLDAGEQKRHEDNPERLLLPPYPSSDEEVLATCLQRAEWWKEALIVFPNRGQSCGRHQKWNLVTIAAHSLVQSTINDIDASAQINGDFKRAMKSWALAPNL